MEFIDDNEYLQKVVWLQFDDNETAATAALVTTYNPDGDEYEGKVIYTSNIPGIPESHSEFEVGDLVMFDSTNIVAKAANSVEEFELKNQDDYFDEDYFDDPMDDGDPFDEHRFDESNKKVFDNVLNEAYSDKTQTLIKAILAIIKEGAEDWGMPTSWNDMGGKNEVLKSVRSFIRSFNEWLTNLASKEYLADAAEPWEEYSYLCEELGGEFGVKEDISDELLGPLSKYKNFSVERWINAHAKIWAKMNGAE